MATIETRLSNHVGYVSLQNEGRHNALDQQAWLAIPMAVSELVQQGARALVVSGQGGSFCAGADISEFDTVRKDAKTALRYEKANADAFSALSQAPVPTLAAIDGYCLGGGFGLACACDLRFASNGATFGVPAARLGLAYPVEAMTQIVSAIGEQNAKLLLFTARRFSADQMHNVGFLLDVLREETALAHASRLAEEIVKLAPLTHAATKAAISAKIERDFSHADALGSATFTSDDYAEGRKAFHEKRPAHFTGK